MSDGDLEGFSHFDTKMPPVDSKYNPCPPHAGSGEVDRELTATEMADSALTATIKICNDLALANIAKMIRSALKRIGLSIKQLIALIADRAATNGVTADEIREGTIDEEEAEADLIDYDGELDALELLYCYKHFSILSIQELTFDPGFHRGRRQTRMVASILFTKFDTGVVVCVLLFLFVSPMADILDTNERESCFGLESFITLGKC